MRPGIADQFSKLSASLDRHDFARAARCTFAFVVPMCFAGLPGVHTYCMYAALAAQNIPLLDVRGDYRMRLAILGAASLILSATAALGAAAYGGGVFPAAAATALAVLAAVAMRHFSADYGAPVGIAMMLIFLLTLFVPDPHGKSALPAALWTLGGGMLGVLTQVALWPFRPQHPVRRVVAECWLAAADLFNGLKADERTPALSAPALAQRHGRLAAHEASLREKLGKCRAALEAARTPRNADFLSRLDKLCVLAGAFSRRAVALHTALEHAIQHNPALAELEPAFQPIVVSLTNTSRTIALAVVSRQPAHLALAEVRVRRLGNLLQGFSDKAASFADPQADADLIGMAIPLFDKLKELIDALRATIDRAAERAAFSLELLDTDTWSLKPLASALTLSLKVSPLLVRHAARITVLSVLGVVATKLLHLQHGYWIVFTLIVVLQPDFGATRQKAAQRAAGTFFGALVGTTLIWIPMPWAAKFALMTAFMFCFLCFLRHNYGVAVFFVTPHVILLTEMSEVVTPQFAVERVLCTAAGAVLAIVAAQLFWPLWERSRIPKALAGALRANLDYWKNLFSRIEGAHPLDDATTAAFLRAGSANAEVFASLRRMMGDPENQRDGLEQAAAIANGNQRLTRALNVVALRITHAEPLIRTGLAAAGETGARALETLAGAIDAPRPGSLARLNATHEEIDALRLPNHWEDERGTPDAETRDRTRQIVGQLARAGTEINAMILATETCLREGVFEIAPEA